MVGVGYVAAVEAKLMVLRLVSKVKQITFATAETATGQNNPGGGGGRQATVG